MNFVELSGSEQAVNQNPESYIRQIPTHEFVSKSFNSLSCHLMRLIQRKKKSQQALITEDTETKLVGCLRSTMSPNSNILMINCVDPNTSMFHHSLPSLKFCASMRDQIHKRLKKYAKEGNKTKKQQNTSSKDISIMMLNQIKSTESIMDDIKSKVVDFEYKLQSDPQDVEVLQEAEKIIRELRDLQVDMDTFINYAHQNQSNNQLPLDSDLLKTAKLSINKLKYLDSKIVQMMNQNYRNQMMQASSHSRSQSGASYQQQQHFQPIRVNDAMSQQQMSQQQFEQ